MQKSPTTLHALLPPVIELATNECTPVSLTIPAAEKGQVGASQVGLDIFEICVCLGSQPFSSAEHVQKLKRER